MEYTRISFTCPFVGITAILLVLIHFGSVGASTCVNLSRIISKYHGGAEHCVCPVDERCFGSACTVGHRMNGNAFNNNIFGYKLDCRDCRCEHRTLAPDFAAIRARREIWIIGTHHKTGSFLNQRLWNHLHQVVHPWLEVITNSFRPMSKERWLKLPKKTDVVVNFHAQGINSSLAKLINRPYKFVHVVRNPVKQIVSAVLYEMQREGLGIHDVYYKTIRSHKENITAALESMAKFMMPSIVKMEEQFIMAAADHNAMNVKLEDFTASFDDTNERIFNFLGVPKDLLLKFLMQARQEDLSRRSKEELQASSHVTRGKYNKGPMEQKLASHEVFGPTLARVQRTMGYL